MPTLNQLRKDVLTACRIVDGKRLVEGYGHVSVRIPGTARVLVTPRVAVGLIRSPAELVVVDLEGKGIQGKGFAPLEIFMHTEVYRRRPDVQAICRTHSPMALALSVLGESVKPVHGFGSFLGEVPVFPKPYLITTRQLGEEVAATLGSAGGMLLRGNGTLLVGATLAEAVVKAIFLEETAAVHLRARSVGEPVVFSAAEIARRTDVGYDHYGRAWDYYARVYGKGARR